MKIKRNYLSPLIFLYCIMLYTFVALYNDAISIPILSIIGGILLVNFVFQLIKINSKRCIFVMLISASLFIISLISTIDISLNFKYFLNWLLTVLIFNLYSNREVLDDLSGFLNSKHKLLDLYSFAFGVLLIILLFRNSSYSSVWNGRYFTVDTTAHSVASDCCLYLLIVFYCLFAYKPKGLKRMLYYFYILIGCAAILETGSRTFLISIIALTYLFIFELIKNRWKRIGMLLLLVLAGIYVVSESSMTRKFIETFKSLSTYHQNTNLLGAISSGRTDFWLYDFNAFIQNDVFHIIVGNGFDYVFYVNLNKIGMFIWGHNDIIQTLLSFGLIGLSIYMYSIFKFLKSNSYRSKKYEFVLLLYMFLPMVINGLMVYASYLYSIIFLILIFNSKVNDASKDI